MFEALLLAAAGGVAGALTVWALAARIWHQSPRQQVLDRLKQLVEESDGAAEEETASLQKGEAQSRLSLRVTRFFLGSGSVLFLEQAAVRISVWTLILCHACCGALGFTIGTWFRMKAIVVLLLAGGGFILPTLYISRRRQIRFRRLVEQLPEAIRIITSSLRAGLGMDAGIEIVATELDQPVREEFQKLLNERRLHTDPNEAFRRFARRIPIRDYRLFSASACLHREVGGNFAELLDQLEGTVRERFELYREVKTLTAESRLSAWILGLLPVLVASGIWVLNADYFFVLWENKMGRLLLWSAFGLQLLGVLTVRFISSVKVH